MSDGFAGLPGAVTDESGLRHLGNPLGEQRALAQGTAIAPLGDRTVLAVTGEDRLSWLDSLTSQALTQLAPGESTELLVLDPHGHVEHAASVIDDGETAWLIVDRGDAEGLLAWLRRMRFRLRVEPRDASDEVAVIGGGPIGLLCVMAASSMGGSVTLIEPQPHRRTLGLEVGASRALDPGAAPLAEQAGEVTGSRGFDVVIEAAGAPAAMASALPIAALGARLVFVGIDVGGTATAEIGLVQSKALQVRGIIGSAGLWPRTIRFMATSGLDPTPLLTARFPLDDAPAALEAARDTSRNVKVQIEC